MVKNSINFQKQNLQCPNPHSDSYMLIIGLSYIATISFPFHFILSLSLTHTHTHTHTHSRVWNLIDIFLRHRQSPSGMPYIQTIKSNKQKFETHFILILIKLSCLFVCLCVYPTRNILKLSFKKSFDRRGNRSFILIMHIIVIVIVFGVFWVFWSTLFPHFTL